LYLEEIKKLSSSSSFLRLADSILLNVDRNTLAEFLAAYLYFNSKGKSTSDFAFFIVTKKFGKTASISMNVVAAIVPGLLFDGPFRSLVLDALTNQIKHGRGSSTSYKT
jgi:hypothetical protein